MLVARLQINHPGKTRITVTQLTDMTAKLQSELHVHCTTKKLTADVIGTRLTRQTERGASYSRAYQTAYHVSSIGEAPDCGSCPLMGP